MKTAIPIVAVALSAGLMAQDPSPADWVRRHAIPLAAVEASRGFDDMQPLKKIIGDARIVALGEATHGTREFFQLKHRMLEFLAAEMGFTIFSIEANMPESYRLNDYVLNGTGDPRELLRGLYFWTWDTEEVLAMIEWMRELNRSGKGRVEFTGFDMQTPTVAAGIVRDFCLKHDSEFAATVQKAMPSRDNAFGVATGRFPVDLAAGKRIRYSGYIRTDGVTRGWAGLWLRVDGPSGPTYFDNMQQRGATGTAGWTRYEIDAPVDTAARNINFGALLAGNGTAWFDALTIEVDGERYAADSIDLDFESAPPRGFNTGGQGYQVEPDKEFFQSGAQSLRMRHQETSQADSSEAWSRVIAHLSESRARYLGSGAADREIAWTLQNARVVLQAIQMRLNPRNRDLSMAENVKWILDENPRAKIVLWAHNGHVAKSGFGVESMGSVLTKYFPNQMTVFGFAFGEGSFQAMPLPPGGGSLRTFTVPAAPADSFDATLAQTGLPLFALDLRQAPEWFRQPRRTRQIGCCYSEDQPDTFLLNVPIVEAFDAVLFMEKTTAARKNPAR